jgi:hypothetical protein
MRRFHGVSTGGTVSEYIRLPDGPGRRILMGIARADAAEKALELPGKLDLYVADVMPSAMAFFNAVAQFLRRPSRPFMAVDIGHEGTDVVIGRKGVLLFARRMHPGASEFPDDALSPGNEAGSAALQRWMEELRSCLTLYGTQGDDRERPTRLVLCGGGGRIEHLAERLSKDLGLETVRLEEETPPKRLEEPGRFATAAGLALAGLGRGDVRLSLLPQPVRERRALRWQLKYWVASGAGAVLALILIIAGLRHDVKGERHTLDIRARQLSALRELEQRLDDAQMRNAGLRERTAPLRVAVHNGLVVQRVLHALARAKHADDWLTLVADADSYFIEQDNNATNIVAAMEERAAPDNAAVETVVVEGYTPVEDLSTVRAMIEKLRTSSAVAGADLLGDDRVVHQPELDERWAETGCRLFAVEITVTPP